MAERDPFPPHPVGCDTGINQYQCGLDSDTRNAAMEAVRVATQPFAGRRDVFVIDAEISFYMRNYSEAGRKLVVKRLLEEMLSRG